MNISRLNRSTFLLLRQNGSLAIKAHQSCFGGTEINNNIAAISAAV